MRSVDRRSFLSAAAAGTAVTLTGAAMKRIPVGILGTQHGHVKGKLRALKELPYFEIAAICEPDQEALKKAKLDPAFDGLNWVSEDRLLADPAIRVIVAECRIWEAIPWGRKVIEAGKHLHLEKPPGNEYAAFRDLVEEARRKRLLLQMGYVFRCHKGINAAFEAARKGWLGDVYMIRATINKDLDAELRPDWARYKGGTLFELGGHFIDRVVDFWGSPTRVRSWLRNDTIKDGLADNTVAVFDYDDGLAVVYSAVRMAGSSKHRSFELIGTDGSFIIQPIEPGDRVQVVLREAHGPYQAGWQEVEMPRHRRYLADLEDLGRALRDGVPLKYSYDFELQVQEALLRASQES